MSIFKSPIKLKLTKKASSYQKNEEEMWREWVRSGKNPAALRPLLKSLEPLAQKTFNKYRTADVSPEALKQEIENQLIRGLETYSPSKGSLSTHLNWQMRNVGRFVERHQNLSRIPSNRIRYIGPYMRAKAELTEQLNREPTVEELHRATSIPKKHLSKLNRELRPVHITGLNVDPATGEVMDVHSFFSSPDMERLRIVYPDLTPQEKRLVDLVTGKYGKPVTSTSQLAKKMGVSGPRVSSIRANIAKKIKQVGWVR